MCGICCIGFKGPIPSSDVNYGESLLKRRGPNNSYKYEAQTTCYSLKFINTILSMRGNSSLQNSSDILLWNGEIYSGIEVDKSQNDTDVLRDLISKCQETEEILQILGKIKGPWAFIYWKASKKQLIFGRDFIGRRSLLWGHSPNYPFIISSLAFDVDSIMWEEIPANGIFCLDLSIEELIINHYTWSRSITGCSQIEVNKNDLLAIPFKNKGHIEINCLETLNKISPIETSDSTISDARLIDLGYDGEKKIPLPSLQEVKELCEILSQAVKVRVDNQPECCKDCFQSKSCFHSSVSILYSGGLDSSVIAILADRHVSNDQPIDLLNVAFEHTQGGKSTFLSPDRKAALEGVEELRRIAPTRKWNLIEVNVTKDEVDKFRDKYIKELLYPNKTVLDESIGCACWFAAQGEGLLNGTSYRTPSRVILLGMGADEQLCGYTRHRVAFKNGGWLALIQEISKDIDNISSRNLGRDDRILSDSSREPRYPFLDEDVISYLNSIPIWLKADLNLPPGIGDKILLRLVAQSLNLKKASQKAKQAIQFGSKFVKIQNPKEKGHNKSNRL